MDACGETVGEEKHDLLGLRDVHGGERGVQMFDYMMNEKQLSLRDEVRGLVEWVPRQMVLDMDADKIKFPEEFMSCLLYTSDAADDLLCVDLGGRRIIKKKKKQTT